MATTKSNKKKTANIDEVRGRLFKLIFEMSEADTNELLQEINIRYNSKNKEKERRRHTRKRTFIPIDCSGNKCTFTDFIQNISESGLYIETKIPLFTNQELLMSFSHTASSSPVNIKGTIVRIDSNGIGVQFDGLVPCI
jgi:hypothetical protein